MHTLEQLNAFIAVYEQGSYSGAAKTLDKSRTTVREHVVSYEDSLGYSLFTIAGRKALATEQADQLYFRAKVVEKQNRELHSYSQALFDNSVHTINIVHDVVVPLSLMLQFERKVREHFPTLTLNWLHRTRQEALEMLQVGKADIAIMPNREKLFAETEVTWVSLGSLHLKIYVGRNSALLLEPSVTINHLQNETQYITENFLAMNVDYAKVSPKMHVVSNNDLLCELLKENGWAAMPEEYMQNYLALGELRELSLEELTGSKVISLNAFFAIGKKHHAVFAKMIDWLAVIGSTALR